MADTAAWRQGPVTSVLILAVRLVRYPFGSEFQLVRMETHQPGLFPPLLSPAAPPQINRRGRRNDARVVRYLPCALSLERERGGQVDD